MAPVTNGRLLFNSVPTGMSLASALEYSTHVTMMPQGYPEPGKTTVYDTSETIDVQTVALNGGFLVKTLELSIDPYIRGRMLDEGTESYSVSF